MKEFIKNYIDVFDYDMTYTQEEKIETAIDFYEVLKSKDAQEITIHIIKPLLTEYRDTEDKATIEDIEELFRQLLQVIL